MEDKARAELAELLNVLADGGSVQLGEFGDGGQTTVADVQAAMLRDMAADVQATVGGR